MVQVRPACPFDTDADSSPIPGKDAPFTLTVGLAPDRDASAYVKRLHRPKGRYSVTNQRRNRASTKKLNEE
ncbi:MAG: hypothetical protein QOE16_279 [Microbacteriaceae bacterium]|nr:hypothetical protein [Microbacteriaceae bacterium]